MATQLQLNRNKHSTAKRLKCVVGNENLLSRCIVAHNAQPIPLNEYVASYSKHRRFNDGTLREMASRLLDKLHVSHGDQQLLQSIKFVPLEDGDYGQTCSTPDRCYIEINQYYRNHRKTVSRKLIDFDLFIIDLFIGYLIGSHNRDAWSLPPSVLHRRRRYGPQSYITFSTKGVSTSGSICAVHAGHLHKAWHRAVMSSKKLARRDCQGKPLDKHASLIRDSMYCMCRSPSVHQLPTWMWPLRRASPVNDSTASPANDSRASPVNDSRARLPFRPILPVC